MQGIDGKNKQSGLQQARAPDLAVDRPWLSGSLVLWFSGSLVSRWKYTEIG